MKVDTGATPLSMSASRKESELVVTLVNPRHDQQLSVSCGVSGASISSARARALHHPDLNACNTFEAPDTIVPRDHEVTMSGGKFAIELPPLSVATVTARLS